MASKALFLATLLLWHSRVTGTPRDPEDDHSEVLCRKCGREMADPSYLLPSELSPFDTFQKNLTSLFGVANVPVQELKNPHGFKFNCVLFRKAGCVGYGEWSSEATWFPGYAWRVCGCPSCGSHLGWMFEPEETITESQQEKPSSLGFYALILDKLIDEKCTYCPYDDASSLLAGLKFK